MEINANHTVFKSAGIIAVFALLSRLVGLYRDRLFASRFGAGDLLDAYYSAFRIPDLVFNLLVLGTLSVVFIPVFTEFFIKDKIRAQKIANTVLTFSFIAMSALCLLLYFFAKELTHIAAPGFTGRKFEETLMLTKIFLLSPVIFTLSTLFTSVLNALKHFFLAALAPILYNFGIIAGIVYFYPHYGIKGLGYGVILGALAHLLTQLTAAVYSGFRPAPAFAYSDPAVKKMGKLFLWRIIGVDSAQVSLLVASIIGSTLISGTVAVFNLANNLQAVIVSMFGISFATAAFPNLSENFAVENKAEFSRVLGRTAVHILFFSIPISVLFILLRAQIVRVILGAGQFDWNATRLTANTLGIFAFSIFAQSLAPLFSRAFYAMHNTVIPVVIGLLSMAANAGLSLVLGNKFGAIGLGAGFTIANILNLFLLWLALRPKLSNFKEKEIAATALKIIIATAAMAVAAYFALRFYSIFFDLSTGAEVFGQGLFAGALGIITFIMMAAVLKLDEVRIALAVLKRKIFWS